MKRAMLLLVVVSCRGPSTDAIATNEEKNLPKKPPKVDEKPSVPPKKHRANAAACATEDAPSTTATYGRPGAGPACTTKADCKPSSRCVGGHCRTDECQQDGDCKGTAVCACDPMNQGHRCLESDCRVDADCGPGKFCSPSFGLDCGAYHGVLSYRCHTKDDVCRDDEDCQKNGATYAYCAFEPKSGHWVCGHSMCKG